MNKLFNRSRGCSSDMLEGCAAARQEVRDSNPAGSNVRNRVSKFGGIALLAMAALLGAGLTSCHDHDNRRAVLPPELKAAPNTLAGVITNVYGDPVKDATVTLGDKSVKTDASGAYLISDVAQGNYTVTASATGLFTATATVNFTKANEQNLLWSVSLNRKVQQTLVVTNSAEDASGNVDSDNIPNNEEGAVNIKVEVPANTVPDNTTIAIVPIYTTSDAKDTKAGNDEDMLIGATVTCSDPNLVLNNPIDVVFDLDESVITNVTVKEFDAAKGTWSDVTPEINGDQLTVKTKKFTSFGIFLPVTISTATSTVDLAFDQDLFDNRKGSGKMTVDNATFKYKTGTAITTDAKNKLQGLLIEYLARQFGAKVTELDGSYPVNVTLEVGQGIVLKGTQAVDTVKVSSRNTSVTGTRYGNVTVTTSAFSVDHNGGVIGDL